SLGGPLDEAFPPMSVSLLLEDDIDISRGSMLCRPNNRPHVGQDVEAMVVWMADAPLQARGKYGIKHTTQSARAMVKDFRYRLNIHTLRRETDATQLGLNEIGRVSLRTTAPLLYDEYRRCRSTGSFILTDESTNNTVGLGLIIGASE
ncbi:MAG: bifunctional sulfate adenylyltransferase subunit 1/adenylylsulfate kinase, partial [Phycisphaerales bacterium]|nr:bifunctional sulfate adenylyltransferase subunit 1/adenylylsulfate kinase [Phycisphaerales bacterium]